MKTKNLLIGAMILSLGALTACNTVQETMENIVPVSSNHVTEKPVVPAKPVKIFYSQKDLPKHYETLGRVSADNFNFIGVNYSESDIDAALKKEAAKKGANGIMNIKSGLAKTTAEAIVFTK